MLGLFLFWRAGRHELVDSQTLLDTAAVFFMGALIIGRVTDFIVRYDFYKWSIRRLIFFNAFSGFDLYGALVGGLILVFLFLRSKRENFWYIFDFAAQGFAFCAFVYSLVLFILGTKYFFDIGNGLNQLLYTIGYLVIFWAVKKFELRKKHKGFSACFFIVSNGFLNLGMVILFKNIPGERATWVMVFSSLSVILGTIGWYLLSKRKLFVDVKTTFGASLLFLFKLKRILTNLGEANNLARILVLSPFLVVKWVYFLVKYIGRELYLSIVDFVHAFGIGR